MTEQEEEVPLTEGEEIIAQFFDNENIKYDLNKELEGLSGDSKEYRIPDFYLPKFNLCVEFLGQWNVRDQKPRYLEKMKVYRENKIPCVYLYPDNLGILKYIFASRAKEELRKYGTRKDRIAFAWFELGFANRIEIGVVIIGCVYLAHRYGLLNWLHYLIFDILVGLAIVVAGIDISRKIIALIRNKE